MSTTHSPESPLQASQPDADHALDFFEETVWYNNEVCSHCFARIRRSMEGRVITVTGKAKHVDESWRTEQAFLGEDLEDPPDSVVGVSPLARPRTTCAECGSVGAKAVPGTLSRREALERVPRLAERLRELGYDVDEDRIKSAVGHLKSKEEYEADDKHVFAVAVALGVDRA